MAKGDANKAQNQIDYRGNQAQNQLTNTFNNLLPQNQSLQNRYNVAADQSEKNYGQMYNSYNDLLNQLQGQYGALNNQVQGSFQPQYAGYQDFATTGGFTPQNIQDIRARAEAPIRSSYANALADLKKQQAISGGNLANFGASAAKMAREQGYANADAETNANAAIAQLVQQGRLAGLGGLNATDTAKLGLLNSVLSNQSGALNETLGGQRSLYGTTPGQTSMYGTQLGQSNQQMNEIQQLQNQLAQIIINGQLGKASVPGDYQQALGNIGGTLGLAGQVGGVVSGFGGLPGGGLYNVGSGSTPAGYIGG